MRAAVIGGGSWGSAFARYLGHLKIKTILWIREEDILEEVLTTRENRQFLPGFSFPSSVSFTAGIAQAVVGSDMVFIAVPSQFCRSIYKEIAPHLSADQSVVSLTKGIEQKSLMRMTQIMDEVFRPQVLPQLAVLSGPSFAREVAEGHPTALVLASKHEDTARHIQRLLSSLTVRVYTSRDVAGVELAGALKNVIAIAAGIADGLETGHNTMAALITRGLVEITRLGLSLGARSDTFFGLAGMGDLMLTCTGELSRNHFVGVELGRGHSLKNILSRMKMVAEGVRTTLSVHMLARRESVEMPISDQVYQVIYKNKPPGKAVIDLMSRALRNE